MKLRIYSSEQSAPLHEVHLTDLTFDFKERQFLLEAGYSRSPVLTDVMPTEISIYPAELRLRFASASQAAQFLEQLREASSDAGRRINAMLD